MKLERLRSKSNQAGQTAANSPMPGGRSAAPNCRFDTSVAVHSLRPGGVMSAIGQFLHAWNISGNKLSRMN